VDTRKKKGLLDFRRMKEEGEKLTWLTAYDYPTATFEEQAGIDMILVGDSMGNTVYGYQSGTLPVTMDMCIVHCQAVRRGAPNTFVMGDMPFGSYQTTPDDAVRNAVRFFKEAEVDAVKLEGGREMADRIVGIVAAGIPVMGHLGLTPQSAGAQGGFRVQGKGALQAKKIYDDAQALIDAGVFAILLEMVPDRLCQLITEMAGQDCIIISLGSGPHADGQLLIYHDMFGLYPKFKPRMAKVYGNAGEVILEGLKSYASEVMDGAFPQPENWFGMADGEYDELVKLLGKK